jgi:lipopolysaccharide transport system ATP-binding protein
MVVDPSIPTADSDTLVKVEGVSKKFCLSLKKSLWYGLCDMGRELTGRRRGEHGGLRTKEFWAVNNVSFELKRGECLGLIGRNGAGKTTLLKMLNGLIKPDGGRIEMRGRVGALIALGAGFNPILTGRENIYVNGSVLGLSKKEIDAKLDEIIDFAEIGDFIDTPVQNYSSGMAVRLGFSVASSFKPDILLLDEVLAVGDMNFQAKCFRRIGDNLANSAVILVSHNPYHISKMCDHVILMQHGKVIEAGPTQQVLSLYQEMNKPARGEPLQILGREAIRAELHCKTHNLQSGDTLEVVLDVETREKVWLASSYLNLADAGEVVHAQIPLKGFDGELPAGKTRFAIQVGPLHLANGDYYGNLLLCQSGGKQTLVHMRRGFQFEFKGPASMGPVYYPPAELQREIIA